MRLSKILIALLLLPAFAVGAAAENHASEMSAGEIMYNLTVPWPFRDWDGADTDGDGVPDSRDACADTPMGAIVDDTGCAVDSDGDGVADGLDQCDGTPAGAKVDLVGCPIDSDGDGVADGIDRCDGTPAGAKVDLVGCPIDSDGDGIADGIDRCDGTPAGAEVDTSGCPVDSDGDGVFDGLDLCANTPAGAAVDARGCPTDVSETYTQFLDTGMIRSSKIRFESGKAELKADSHGAIDEIGGILVQWPQLRIEIGGYTDSSGDAGRNQALSEARAQAVLGYLRDNFPKIESSQYSVKGYGEKDPIASNETRAGRAENRRVEFKVLNREALKKVMDKRSGH